LNSTANTFDRKGKVARSNYQREAISTRPSTTTTQVIEATYVKDGLAALACVCCAPGACWEDISCGSGRWPLKGY